MADSHREEIAKLEALYSANPEGRVFTHLAEAYRKAGELDRARGILEDGLQRHGDYSSAHVVLGRVLTDMGELDDAAVAFRRVLELDRHNLIALRSLGELASDANRTEEALLYYRELVSLDPSDERLRAAVDRLEAQRGVELAPPAEPAIEEGGSEPVPASTEGLPDEVLHTGPAGLEAPEAGDLSFPETPEVYDASSSDVQPLDAGPLDMEPLDVDPAAWSLADPAGDEPESAEIGSFDLAWTGFEAAQTEEAEPSGGSGNWEEDVGIELDALPGDLGALAHDAPGPLPDERPDQDAARREPDTSQPFEAETSQPFEAETSQPFEAEPSQPYEAEASQPFEAEASQPFEAEASQPFEAEAPLDTGDEWVVSSEWLPDSGAFDYPEPDPSLPDDDEPSGVHEFEGIAGEPAGAFPDSSDVPASEPAMAAPGELVTETMAELYFAQGFYSRAAEVYRSLVRDRPDDVRLQDRLREAESLMAWPGSTPPDESEEPQDGWLEGIESAWTGGGGVAGREETPYAWAEPRDAEQPSGPQVGQFFQTLLGWRPGAGGAQNGGAEAVGQDTGEYTPSDYGEAPSTGSSFGDAVGEASSEAPWSAGTSSAPELPEAASAAGADDEAGENDEDLEMFRSWLQSLKK